MRVDRKASEDRCERGERHGHRSVAILAYFDRLEKAERAHGGKQRPTRTFAGESAGIPKPRQATQLIAAANQRKCRESSYGAPNGVPPKPSLHTQGRSRLAMQPGVNHFHRRQYTPQLGPNLCHEEDQ